MENLFRIETEFWNTNKWQRLRRRRREKIYVWLNENWKQRTTEKQESFAHENLHSLNTKKVISVYLYLFRLFFFVFWESQDSFAYCLLLRLNIFLLFHSFWCFFAQNKKEITIDRHRTRDTHKTNVKRLNEIFNFWDFFIVLFMIGMKLLSILLSDSVPIPCSMRRHTLNN